MATQLNAKQQAFIEHYLIALSLAVASVVSLLKWRGPMAIRWFVVFIAVFAVNGVLGRGPWSHVGEEVFKAIEPAFANLYTSAAIQMIFTVIGVVATCFHTSPTHIFRAIGFSVGGEKLSRLFFVQATARLSPLSK